MNTNEQKAFADAYSDNIGHVSHETVTEIVRLYESGQDVSHFVTYEVSSVVDALGLWHSAIYWNLTQQREAME
jgi:hypothetical protein